MRKIRVTKEFGFEMAHALWNYDGLCKNIHGHSYKLFVTVAGVPIDDKTNPKNGMLIDFGDLKETVKKIIVDKFDHAIMLNKDAKIDLSNSTQMFERVIVSNYQPTCENILLDIVDKLTNVFPENVTIHNVRLYETATSYAEWFAFDN